MQTSEFCTVMSAPVHCMQHCALLTKSKGKQRTKSVANIGNYFRFIFANPVEPQQMTQEPEHWEERFSKNRYRFFLGGWIGSGGNYKCNTQTRSVAKEEKHILRKILCGLTKWSVPSSLFFQWNSVNRNGWWIKIVGNECQESFSPVPLAKENILMSPLTHKHMIIYLSHQIALHLVICACIMYVYQFIFYAMMKLMLAPTS